MPRSLTIEEKTLNEYLDIICLSGISNRHLYEVKRYLRHYLDYTGNTIDKTISIAYFKLLKDRLSISSYRKMVYQIRKFLIFQHIEWANDVKLPAEVEHLPKHITLEDVENTLLYFEKHRYFKQVKAVVLLGASSGLRAEEIYQLELEDIDLENRTIFINHNPSNGQTTKTKQSRVSFFNEDAQKHLSEYFNFFENNSCLKKIFAQKTLERAFRNAPIRVKDLRKYFSQEWDRHSGPTSIKKILMGHSTRHDVDLMHYNYQSEEDLKKIYEKVMS